VKRIMPKGLGRLPGSAAAMLGIGPGEKVVAWGVGEGADATQSLFAAATDRALYLQATQDRIPWTRITKATWEEPVLELVVVNDGDRGSRLVRVRVEDARDLPAAVRDRVTASVIVSERVDLGDGAGALLVARRGEDGGDVRWSVVFDAGLDSRDPRLRAAADAALVDLRASLGI
jgi:hypothetical protein